MEIACPECRKTIEYSREPPRFCSHCGTALAETSAGADATVDHEEQTQAPGAETSSSAATPAVLGDYRVLRELGRGGMGVVYEAEQIETGRHVALKLLPPRVQGSPETVERFLREGRLAASLSHPRSTFIYAAGEVDGKFYIAMELMPGGTVKDVVDREGPLPVGRAVDYVLDAIDGLEAAHAVGVIHRDVKPSNCFLDADGRVKVGDYGLSKSLAPGAELTRTGAFLGTPLFAAPEQIRGEAVDARTDIYALGATLYFLLTGRGPFTGNAAQVIAKISSDAPPLLRTLRPDLPRDLERLVARSLEKDPERRFADADELRRALAPFGTRGASIADLGRRLAAFFLDVGIIGMVSSLTTVLMIMAVLVTSSSFETAMSSWVVLISGLFGTVLAIAYFAVFEGVWGCALGKWLLGLSVVDQHGTAPGCWRAFLRAAMIPGVSHVTAVFAPLTFSEAVTYGIERLYGGPSTTMAMFGSQVVGLVGWAAALVFLTTMRRSNGYRGMHELASGTRTVSLRTTEGAWREISLPTTLPVALGSSPADETLGAEEAAPDAAWSREFGPFQALGILGRSGSAEVWQGRDRALERSAWIFWESGDESTWTDARRTVTRATRPHWLQGGETQGRRWEACEAVSGAPLVELFAPESGLPWVQGRSVLTELAAELRAAAADGSLPESLSIEQLWIDRTGRLKLLDAPLTPQSSPFSAAGEGDVVSPGADATPTEPSNKNPTDKNPTTESPSAAARATAFFRDVAFHCVRGQLLPGHVQEFMDALRDRPAAPETLDWAFGQLEAFAARPAAVHWDHRLATLAMSASTEQTVYLMIAGVPTVALAALGATPDVVVTLAASFLTLLAPLGVGYWLRGGPVFLLTGVQVRLRNGQPASRLRCAWRSLCAWTPVMLGNAFLTLTTTQSLFYPSDDVVAAPSGDLSEGDLIVLFGFLVLWSLLILLPLHAIGAIVAVMSPRRGLQDFLSGAVLAPK